MSLLGSKSVAPFLLALLIGGCPKRQTTPRIVYVQAPPVPASSANAGAGAAQEALTIQEPAPPPAEDSSAKAAPALPIPQPQEEQKPKAPRNQGHDTAEKPAVGTPPPPAATESTLQLQPEGDDLQEAVLGKRLEELTAKLNDLEHRTDLNEEEQRAVHDASTFRTQSQDALHQHDAYRAKQLADKAYLLIRAVEGHP